MDVVHFCAHGGIIADKFEPLATEPSRYQHGALSETVPCTNLVCPQCSERVRSHDGVKVVEDAQLAPAELFAARDWAARDDIVPSPGGRLYCCDCTMFLQTGRTIALDDPDPDDIGHPFLPWRCGGHPLATLPQQVGAVPIAAGIDFRPLVRMVVSGDTEFLGDPLHVQFPSVLLAEIFARLEGLPEADQLSSAVVALLDDPDHIARGTALLLLERFPRQASFDHFANWISGRGRSQLSERFPIRGGGPVTTSPLEVLVKRIGLDLTQQVAPPLLDLVREGLFAASPDEVERTVAVLAQLDAPWLASRVGDLARAGGDRWRAALDALARHGHEALLVVAAAGVAAAGEPHRDELLEWLAEPPHDSEAYAHVIRSTLDMPTATDR